MQDADYCARLVREADKERFLATLFAPGAYRGALYALYAFNVEIARVRKVVHEPLAGEVRLQWWTDVISGHRDGEALANPVAAALADTIARFDLPVQPLLDLIEARVSDLYDDPMATLDELEIYAERTSSALIALAARIAGEDISPPSAELTRHAGIADAITSLLVAFPAHAARGKLYLPSDLMQRHGAQTQDALAGKVTSQLHAVLAEMRQRARWHLGAASSSIDALPAAVVPALLPLAPLKALLARMERPDYDPFAPPDVPQWRRQWLIWRAARRPARIFG